MQELNIPWVARLCLEISNLLWVQERLLGRNDALVEIQGVSRNQLKKGGLEAGIVVQAEGRA